MRRAQLGGHAVAGSRRLVLASLALLTVLTLAPVACGGESAGGGDATSGEGVIARDTFIETYVMLRQAALSSESGEASQADRERILQGAGVSAADMEAFVARFGDDPIYMRDVWDEVERRMRVLAGEIADTTLPAPPGPVTDG